MVTRELGAHVRITKTSQSSHLTTMQSATYEGSFSIRGIGTTKWQYCTLPSNCAFSKCAKRVLYFEEKSLFSLLYREITASSRNQTKFGAEVFERGSLHGTTLIEECVQYKYTL